MATIQRSSWEEVHGGWPMVIVQQLGKLLPPQYVAGPRVHLGSNAGVGVASFELQGMGSPIGARADSGSATATWAPSEPSLVMETELCDVDEYEVRLTGQRDPALGNAPPTVYACACRWRPRGVTHVLETWNRGLSLGQPLPILPLWLSDECAVPLDLEASYEQTCRDLRII